MEKGKNYIVFEEGYEIDEASIGVYVGGVCVQPPRCTSCGEYLYIIPKDKLGMEILSCENCGKRTKMVTREVVGK